jgi:hypothetical protein
MSMQPQAAATVRATLNFAADRTDGGVWSNLMRHLITQALEGCEVEIRDARRLPDGPSLEREGFVWSRTPAPPGADFTDRDWVAAHYAPQCLQLVQQLTGAAHVAPFSDGGVLIRDTGNVKAAPAAEFVHLDQTRESIRPFLEQAADAAVRARWPRVKIFNVWRPLTRRRRTCRWRCATSARSIPATGWLAAPSSRTSRTAWPTSARCSIRTRGGSTSPT